MHMGRATLISRLEPFIPVQISASERSALANEAHTKKTTKALRAERELCSGIARRAHLTAYGVDIRRVLASVVDGLYH